MPTSTLDPQDERSRLDDLEQSFKAPSAPEKSPVSADDLQQHFNRPAAKKPVYDNRGNADSDAPGDKNAKEPPSREALGNAEENAGNSLANKAGTAAAPDEAANPEGDSLYRPHPVSGLKARGWMFNRRRTILGGGLLGTIAGLVLFFSLTAGPFEFIHIAQLLDQAHFSTLSNEQNDRFLHEVRFWRYASTGQIEKTRLGLLGNKLGNSFEKQFNSNGLKSIYSDKFGVFNGYEIDTTSKDSPFKGMSEDDIRAAVKADTGIDVVSASEIKGISADVKPGALMIPGDKLGYLNSLKLNYKLLQATGKGKLASAFGARLMCVRAACTSMFHPMTKLANKGKAAVEEWLKSKQQDENKGNTGDGEVVGPEDEKGKTKETIQDESTAGGEVKQLQADKGDPAKLSLDLKSSALKGAAGVGLACMVYSVNERAGIFKQTEVILPLVRMSALMLGMGGQFQAGQDVNLSEASALSGQLHGKDSSGKVTGWNQAEPFGGSVAPSSTLTSIGGSGGPFDSFVAYLQKVTFGHLGTVCSGAVQGALGGFQLLFDLTGGGEIETAIIQGVGTAIGATVLQNQLVSWLSGHAVDVAAVGADFGNEISYGGALAANEAALATGGVAMTDQQTGQLSAANSSLYNSQFSSKNIAYKLFNPNDERSAISKLIDNTSPSVTQNLARMGSMFLNFGHMFSSIGSLFSPKVQAASTGYDYGLPTYGFSAADMDNSAVQNPYKNAADVRQLIDSTGGGTSNEYITKAEKCFGVTIDPTTWDVTSSPDKSPLVYGNKSYSNFGCGDDSDPNWLKVRFFIMDTETMNGMACAQGDDSDPDIAQACADTGFGGNTSPAVSATSASSAPTSSQSSGNLPSGTSQQLAQELLPYIAKGKIFCGSAAGGSGSANCSDIQNTAKDQPLGGNCQVSALTPHLLGLILGLVKDDGWTLGISAMCSDHHAEGDGPYAGHSYGSVADFSVQNTAAGVSAASDQAFVNDAASLLSSVGGSFGQVATSGTVDVSNKQCHLAYPSESGSQFTLFPDDCSHQHIRAAP